MNHPDVLRVYSLDNFLFMFKQDCLEISSKDIKWTITGNDKMIQWKLDRANVSMDQVGPFILPGSCPLADLEGTLFYNQIKEWIQLSNNL